MAPAGPHPLELNGGRAHNAIVQEHHGNGEHPESLERRRQVLVWRSLGALVLIGAATGVLRLVVDLLGDAPVRSLVYQLVLLALNVLVGVFVVARLRALRRR
jgi:hypothetical protein